MIADADSSGIHWVYVELESPGERMFLKNGELAKNARHGIHQIREWRQHIDRNGGEARRLRSEGGLGLPEVRSKGWGIVLIGRTETIGEDRIQLRRQVEEDERIMLHTYDWLIDRIEAIASNPKLEHHLGGLIPYSGAELDEHRKLRQASEVAGTYPDGFDVATFPDGDTPFAGDEDRTEPPPITL
jgi:hypothetical protein